MNDDTLVELARLRFRIAALEHRCDVVFAAGWAACQRVGKEKLSEWATKTKLGDEVMTAIATAAGLIDSLAPPGAASTPHAEGQ